jgi:hypothetical protein
VRRYYNAAQLALVACSQLESAGTEDGITKFGNAIRNLVPFDYYVIAASADDPVVLVELGREIDKYLNGFGKHARDKLLNNIRGDSGEFLNIIHLGAKQCYVNDEIRDRTYARFEFAPKVDKIEGLGDHDYHLFYGGRLNASQANSVSEFLNKSAFGISDIMKWRKSIDAKSAYIARIRIDRMSEPP